MSTATLCRMAICNLLITIRATFYGRILRGYFVGLITSSLLVPTICLTTQAKDMETPLFYEEDGYDVAYNEVKRG